jgi:hypothetical protein
MTCVDWPTASQLNFLQEAGSSLRRGDLDDVEILLECVDAAHCGCAANLNLLGVVREARGDLAQANHFYRRAIKADPSFAPAQQNLRRQYELDTIGWTGMALAIGEPLTDLWLDRHLLRPHR